MRSVVRALETREIEVAVPENKVREACGLLRGFFSVSPCFVQV